MLKLVVLLLGLVSQVLELQPYGTLKVVLKYIYI